MAVRYGTSANNNINGTEQGDRLYGLAGNDNLNGRGGDDLLDGGTGNDSLDGGNGTDRLFGGDGEDRIYAGYGNDFVYGGRGDDGLHGRQGSDLIDGGEGNDLLFGGQDTANDILLGGIGNDILLGERGADYLNGGGTSLFAEIDILQGNTLDGLADGYVDTFALGVGNDIYYGEAGQYAVVDDFALGEDLIQLASTDVTWTEDDSYLAVENVPGAVAGVPTVALDSITGQLSNYQYANGVVEDVYRINATAGFSATTIGGTSLDTVLTLYDTLGNVVASNDDSGGTLQSTLAVDGLTGEYLIGVSSYSKAAEGSYSVDFTGVVTNAAANYEVLSITSPEFLQDVIPDFRYGSGIYHNNDLVAVINQQDFIDLNLVDTSQFTFA